MTNLNELSFEEEMKEAKRRTKRTNAELETSNEKIYNAVSEISSDHERATDVINNAPAIIHDIDTQFEMATRLRKKDIVFLFGAAAIQTARWILLPSMDFDFSQTPKSERLTSSEGGNIERQEIKKYLSKSGLSEESIKDALNERGKIRNYTWDKLLIAPVPYDAMHGSKRIVIEGISDFGTEIYGKNHHVATWGHDPIFGWVFGPLNITSRMITFKGMQTFHVAQVGESMEQVITYRSSLPKMISKSVNCWKDDSKCLFASVAKQGMHIASDKYTKGGLAIPLVSTPRAQQLLENGWNSAEAEKIMKKCAKNIGIIGAQLILSVLIDNLVKGLHLLCYDESVDGSIGTYSVRTSNIICYSNALSSIANGIYVATTGNIGKLDIGGYINLARDILNNKNLRHKMKAEFLEKEFADKLRGKNYSFEESDLL